MSKGWIGVDFDGTLAHYTTWGSITSLGEPVWPMVERVKQWLEDGYEVRIVTARMAPPNSAADVEKAIGDWCEEYVAKRLPVTCSKDLDMIELWDDRAVQVAPNTGQPTVYWLSRL
jgi:5'(3')-deoxyribonucleotidase